MDYGSRQLALRIHDLFNEKVSTLTVTVTLTLTLNLTVIRYRHVVNNRTKCVYLGKMPTEERIRFSMWTSNDYLPGHRFRVRVDLILVLTLILILILILTGFKRVGWEAAKKYHAKYESITGTDDKVRVIIKHT